MKQRTKAAAILKLIHYIADSVTLAVTSAGVRCATERWLAEDRSFSGRVLVWWSEDAPRLIECGDRGYRDFVDFS
jgi:hypothetical protein